MTSLLRRSAIVMGCLALLVAGAPHAFPAAEVPASFADLAEDKLPAVVNISTRQKVEAPQGMPALPPPLQEFFGEFFGQAPGGQAPARPREMTALGSGFIVSADGYVVTNNHVIENADEIAVVLQDDTELAAKLVGRDPMTDLALLKVSSDKPLPAAEWGDSDALRIGDWVLAIGNPFGLGGTVTAGIISARARDIQSGPYDDYLQTDASINRGNSGGPLFSTDGRVIGVNAAILSPSGGNIGIGFAIPSAIAMKVVDELRATGAVRRGWLGVQLQPMTKDLAQAMGLERAEGGLIAQVEPNSPAAKAGLAAGDVVVEFEGRRVEDGRDLSRFVASQDPGAAVDLVVLRDGTRSPHRVTLGTLPQQQTASLGEQGPSGEPRLGLTLAPLTPDLRRQLGLPEGTSGVAVAAVQPGTPAAQQGLRRGDVILRAGNEPVDAPEDVAAALKQAAERNRGAVLLRVQRGERQFFAAVPLKSSESAQRE